MRVRIVRQSLWWATCLDTWNVFDWHMAALWHKKADRVKIVRWAEFDHRNLLKGSDLKCEIKEKDLHGTFDALWFRPASQDMEVNRDKVVLYMHGMWI